MALISIEQAATHLRLNGNEYANDLKMKIAQAEAHVLTYIKRSTDSNGDEWTSESTDREFKIVQGCILEVLANLWGDRGDREKPMDGPITPRIKNALAMLRDPALA